MLTKAKWLPLYMSLTSPKDIRSSLTGAPPWCCFLKGGGAQCWPAEQPEPGLRREEALVSLRKLWHLGVLRTSGAKRRCEPAAAEKAPVRRWRRILCDAVVRTAVLRTFGAGRRCTSAVRSGGANRGVANVWCGPAVHIGGAKLGGDGGGGGGQQFRTCPVRTRADACSSMGAHCPCRRKRNACCYTLAWMLQRHLK